MVRGFPADYPILTACYLDLRSKYRRLSGRPRIQGRPLDGFRPQIFPIKAPTRQMLYPLSYRGTFSKLWHVSTSKIYVNRGVNLNQDKQKEIAHEGDLFEINRDKAYAARVWCWSLVSANTRRPLRASSIISRTAEVSGLTSIRSHAFKCLTMPSVAISSARPLSFEKRRAWM